MFHYGKLSHYTIPVKFLTPRMDSNHRKKVLQTLTYPLGHVAVNGFPGSRDACRLTIACLMKASLIFL